MKNTSMIQKKTWFQRNELGLAVLICGTILLSIFAQIFTFRWDIYNKVDVLANRAYVASGQNYQNIQDIKKNIISINERLNELNKWRDEEIEDKLRHNKNNRTNAHTDKRITNSLR